MEKNEYLKMYEFENDYWWYRGLHELIKSYVEVLKKEKNKKREELTIFDAGCGTGRLMELLEGCGRVEGVDYSDEAVALCGKRGLKLARKEDLNTWAPAAETYDVIISCDVICTTGIEDDMAAVTRFFHALKPGGIVILNLPAFTVLRRRHDIAVSGKRRYRKKETIRQLQEIGFMPLHATYRLSPLFFVMLAKKYFIDPFSRGEAESDLKTLPAALNSFLLRFHRWENRRIIGGRTFPFGSSLFLVCRKEDRQGQGLFS